VSNVAKRAVIIGGGLAGMFAARALADSCMSSSWNALMRKVTAERQSGLIAAQSQKLGFSLFPPGGH
jgi:succinate dehydrogenase/fumarate reductase flavoprotein subunit